MMFDLEKSIAEWRRRMIAGGINQTASLDELESHLREDVERRMRSGRRGQEVFEMAVQQIGKANLLKHEFEKVAGMKEAREGKQTQTAFAVCACGISIFIITCLLFRIGSCSEITSVQQMSGLAAVALTHLLAWGGRAGQRLFPAVRDRKVSNAICFSGCGLLALWWAIFFFVVLPRFDFTISQLVVAIVWGFVTPVGAFVGLATGLEKALRRDSVGVAA
jgi:hypothetical protein